MNLSGTLNAIKIIFNPSLCLPHHTVPTFNHLPIPLNKAFVGQHESKKPDIRAVILDKDNCFAVPHTDEIYEPYKQRFKELREAYPGSKLLIVSNTAGTNDDKDLKQAKILEANTGVKVLTHSVKKPGCRDEIMKYFKSVPDAEVTSPSQIAVVGDRLFTDVVLANQLGSHGFWIREGVTERKSFWYHAETRLAAFLTRRGFVPPDPSKNTFE